MDQPNIPYEGTCRALRSLILSRHPDETPTPEMVMGSGGINLGYLLWMMDQLQGFPEIGKRARWMGWVLAHAEMVVGMTNEESRNLVRQDVKSGRE